MRVIITAGPTREYLDDVRFISNASSGQMGYALAIAAQAADWDVVLVSGPCSLQAPAGVTTKRVISAMEMLEVVLEEWEQADGIIGAAAVADYRPKYRHPGKIRRGADPLLVELVPNPDILAECGLRKREGQWIVGFALEPSLKELETARRKMEKKNCDAMCINPASVLDEAWTNLYIMDRTGEVREHWTGPKLNVAAEIVGWIIENLVPKTQAKDGE